MFIHRNKAFIKTTVNSDNKSGKRNKMSKCSPSFLLWFLSSFLLSPQIPWPITEALSKDVVKFSSEHPPRPTCVLYLCHPEAEWQIGTRALPSFKVGNNHML